MAPPPAVELTMFAEMFGDAVEKSKGFEKHYRRVANEKGCYFLNAGDYIESSPLDGIHFEAEMHGRLGKAVAGKVREILS